MKDLNIEITDRSDSCVYNWMKEWIDRTSKEKYENSFNENSDEWIEIEGVGKFKGLKMVSDELIDDHEISISLKYDVWEKNEKKEIKCSPNFMYYHLEESKIFNHNLDELRKYSEKTGLKHFGNWGGVRKEGSDYPVFVFEYKNGIDIHDYDFVIENALFQYSFVEPFNKHKYEFNKYKSESYTVTFDFEGHKAWKNYKDE